ncbi:glucose-1-phosphate thymidylyltransferase [Paenibacillus shirakamiensis]|uniref:Glucose-1-phosphate thymidylyltransferase n=1 Tax=Paenibacillus shirakamiensis TaxID=1265935 RepID=A0ABS4JLZ5_9BACL|nr:sugar phosphate nucleotidyltransferase [Paenibacillus shirakamiensis]MBP2002126.1 glucose-1-phosphate thymidylyltransferase [Paenibacillus shirakamiensis]
MKGVILAGGTGTRLQPLTRLINKHLLQVGKHPMISYAIERLRQAGITDVMIVISKQSAGLYTEYLGSGEDHGVQITYKIQEAAGGIAEALQLTRSYISPGEKFVVLLGDNLFQEDLSPYVKSYEKQDPGSARILLKPVDDPHRYGVPVFDNQDPKLISHIEEKPADPKSGYCVTGIYMYDDEVFKYIGEVTRSARGEMEITDVNNRYARQGKLEYDVLQGWWGDAGTFESLEEANTMMRGMIP